MARWCGGYRCDRKIEAGQLYVRHVAFPGDEGWEEGTVPWVIQQCIGCLTDDLAWIRSYYKVPVTVGMPFIDGTRSGIVGGAAGGNSLCVFFKGEPQKGKQLAVPFHPTDHIVYEDGHARTTRPGRPRSIVTVELAGVS
ncbi:hypothetical protein ACIBTV_25640 [Micromonospora sp. NPDC049366]|uniref:hypothetical protein n=1 Tax=Micromonospora sp. NPDC049366 TaxID=3364271 RepID=UPI0037881787